jgi:hypothetical protein
VTGSGDGLGSVVVVGAGDVEVDADDAGIVVPGSAAAGASAVLTPATMATVESAAAFELDESVLDDSELEQAPSRTDAAQRSPSSE